MEEMPTNLSRLQRQADLLDNSSTCSSRVFCFSASPAQKDLFELCEKAGRRRSEGQCVCAAVQCIVRAGEAEQPRTGEKAESAKER